MSPEAEYLTAQSARAAAAFRATGKAMSEELLAPLAVRPWIQRRPWWSLGVAFAGGIASGAMLRRRRAGAGPQPPSRWLRDATVRVVRRLRGIVGTAIGPWLVASLQRGGSAAKPTDAGEADAARSPASPPSPTEPSATP